MPQHTQTGCSCNKVISLKVNLIYECSIRSACLPLYLMLTANHNTCFTCCRDNWLPTYEADDQFSSVSPPPARPPQLQRSEVRSWKAFCGSRSWQVNLYDRILKLNVKRRRTPRTRWFTQTKLRTHTQQEVRTHAERVMCTLIIWRG